MDLKIRHLELSDNHDLAELYSFTSVTANTSQKPFLSSDYVAGLFDNPNNYTLVAQCGDKVVGHVTLFMSHKVRDKHSAGLAIAIHPDSHGKGIGKALIKEIINQADNWLNLVRIELEVHADNEVAKALYLATGFEVEGTKRLSTFKAGRYVDMHLMSRIRPDHLS
ncbi:GNAT family N-acetyltransferase [Vibrio sp. SCSIO 43135]|uniref:GNAT family N-acetyltransferase n=1 Tax=Vibrio sp. SCSIO 43135 TaxID=2819096 RepID=UPI00207554E9|nr:GNAT family N-acetyltransferase [Vibrio sp. SCSIO 43135]USD42955.1 GNAT family N-acetyltransferase [Vibrio sp. SCSIO 43135]